MEEFIKYFYNINVDKLNTKFDKYTIESNKKKYLLVEYNKDPNKLYKKFIVLKNNRICCHDIIINKDGNILSEYDGKRYLLLKQNINSLGKPTILELINPALIVNLSDRINLKESWQQKNDYYEDIINKLLENKYIKQSFDYYLGLSELSINLLDYVNFNNVNFYVQHERLKDNETLESFFNPINMVVDTRARDIALYIKNTFFNHDINLDNIRELISKINFNDDEVILFLCRLLYPDYYFDICDEIINDNKNNEDIKKCINKNTSYEMFIKDIYNFLYSNYNIPKIEFLIK